MTLMRGLPHIADKHSRNHTSGAQPAPDESPQSSDLFLTKWLWIRNYSPLARWATDTGRFVRNSRRLTPRLARWVQ